MIASLIEWWRKFTCPHRHTEPHFRWEQEWALYYDECLDCGKELYD